MKGFGEFLCSIQKHGEGKARLGLMKRIRERSVEIDDSVYKTIIAHKKQNERASESGGCVDLPGLAVLVEKMRSGQDHFIESFSKLGSNFQKRALSRLFERSRELNTEAHLNMVRKLCKSRNVKRVKGDKDWNVVWRVVLVVVVAMMMTSLSKWINTSSYIHTRRGIYVHICGYFHNT